MPTNASDFGRYSNPGGRPYYPQRSTTPDIEFSESERPAVPLVPAPYLPAGRFDEHKRANIVLSAGTPVALDAAGAMVPAGTPVGHAFTYSSLDFTTGLPKAKKAADGTSVTSATTSIMHSGLGGNRLGFFLEPVGVVSYNAYQFEGGVAGTWPSYSIDYDNPAKFPIHNTQAQPETLVAITCDYILEVPYIYGKNLLSNEAKIFDNSSNEVDVLSANAKSFPFAHDELVRDAGTAVFGSGVKLLYISPACGTGDNGVAGSGVIAGANAGVATFACNGSAAGSAVAINTAGIKVLYTADPAKYIVLSVDDTAPGGAAAGYTAGTVTLKAADTIQPGDFVACRLGKFVKWDRTRMAETEKIGQVLRVRTNAIKRDYLDRVKTAYERSADPAGRMAGSATRGVPYLISLVTDAAQVVFETKKKLDGTVISATGLPTSLPLGSIVINLLR